MAASGGVALFHVEGLTPEAPDLKTVFDGEPKETMTITRADLASLRIGNPGRASMAAAMKPDGSDYFYFVANTPRTHIFSKTYEEHTRAVDKYQR